VISHSLQHPWVAPWRQARLAVVAVHLDMIDDADAWSGGPFGPYDPEIDSMDWSKGICLTGNQSYFPIKYGA